MTDENQIEVPPSFMALYLDFRHRLTEPMSVVRTRYEACEDLAQAMLDHAETLRREHDLAQADVLLGIRSALNGSESNVRPDEADWVVTRLAELLNWGCPPLDD